MTVIKLWEEVSKDFKARDKEQGFKFMTSYALASDGALDILNRYSIRLTKSSQGIVLTQDPKTLLQALDLAEKMKFIDAYREDPKRLTQLVTNVIKRMAKCDALGIPYKDENGRFSNFIFSERDFNAYMISLGKEPSSSPEVAPSIKVVSRNDDAVGFNQATPSLEAVAKNNDLNQVKELALHVLEQFGIVEQQAFIFNRLDGLQYAGFGVKEMLVEAFKDFPGDKELLMGTIDELLEQNQAKETSLRSAA